MAACTRVSWPVLLAKRRCSNVVIDGHATRLCSLRRRARGGLSRRTPELLPGPRVKLWSSCTRGRFPLTLGDFQAQCGNCTLDFVHDVRGVGGIHFHHMDAAINRVNCLAEATKRFVHLLPHEA